MRPELPLFANTDCEYLGVCASTEDADASQLVQKLIPRTMVAAYNAEPGRVYARLLPAGDPAEAHFHIDLALGKNFGRQKPPTTHKKARLLSALRQLADFPWGSRFFAFFTVPRATGERFYTALGTTIETGADAEVSLTGIEFSFRGTHLDRLSVRLSKTYAHIEMFGAPVSGPIRSDYFISALNVFETYLNAFSQGVDE